MGQTGFASLRSPAALHGDDGGAVRLAEVDPRGVALQVVGI
jgi:hypothetical protein